MAQVISKEQATKEVNQWLDLMNIPKAKRESEGPKDYINILIEAVMEGTLIFNEDETITHKLKHPLADGNTKELKYDFRWEAGDYQAKTKGTDVFADEIGWQVARLSLASAEKHPTSVFLKLKRQDYFIASKLTVFF